MEGVTASNRIHPIGGIIYTSKWGASQLSSIGGYIIANVNFVTMASEEAKRRLNVTKIH